MNKLARLWERTVALHHDRIALLYNGQRPMTYHVVDAAAQLVRDELRQHGVVEGRPVIVALRRGPEWVPALLGIWMAGAVAVPGRMETASHLAEFLGAAHMLAGGPATVASTGTEPRDVGLTGEHAYVLATSGSTGNPKYAAVSHHTSAAVLAGLVTHVKLSPQDRMLHTAAFTFSSALRQLMVPLLSGASVRIFDSPTGFNPPALLDAAADVSTLDLTPSHIRGLLSVLPNFNSHKVLPALRRVLLASETVPASLVREWRAAVDVDHQVLHLYGQTEIGGAVSVLVDADELVSGTDRMPLALPFAPFTAHFDGGTGPTELILGGVSREDGIIVNGRLSPLAANQAIDPVHHTGDLFERMADTNDLLLHRGRVDQRVKLLGVSVDLADLEHRINAIEAVTAAAAGLYDSPVGTPAVFVAYQTASAVPGIFDLVTARACQALPAGVAAPNVFELRDMPTTTNGKLDRQDVSRSAADARACRVIASADADILERLWRHFSGAIDIRDSFFSSGGDSLTMIALLSEVEQQFGVRVLPEHFHDQPTLSGLRALVSTAMPSQTQTLPRSPSYRSGQPFIATPTQTGFWINEQLDARAPERYWQRIDAIAPARLDAHRLHAALVTAVDRFDALQLAFSDNGDQLVATPSHDPASAALTSMADIGDPASMTSGELLVRLAVNHQRNGSTAMTLTAHHAIADRRSLELIMTTIAAAYRGEKLGHAPEFAQWAIRHNNPSTYDLAAAAGYWKKALPAPSAEGGGHIGQILQTAVARAHTHHRYVQPFRPAASRHSTWLCAYGAALHHHRCPDPHLIGINIDLRASGEEDLVGLCIVTAPVMLTSNGTDHESIRDAGRAVAAALAHRHVPIASVVSPSERPIRDPRQPFYRHLLVHQAAPYPALNFGDVDATYRRLPPGLTENTTTLFVRDNGDDAEVHIGCSSGGIASAQELLSSVVEAAKRPGSGQ